MRRKPKTESRQRNNRSLNTVGVPEAGDRNERVPTILCLICELIMKGSSAASASSNAIPRELKDC